MWDPYISQPYRPPRPVTGIALLYFAFTFILFWGGVKPIPLPAPDDDDDDECGASGRMIGRGNRTTRRKTVPVSLCPLQIPHEPNSAQTRAAAVRSQRLTA
jgi:hypothetical protein